MICWPNELDRTGGDRGLKGRFVGRLARNPKWESAICRNLLGS
jgi:hypothetical protein